MVIGRYMFKCMRTASYPKWLRHLGFFHQQCVTVLVTQCLHPMSRCYQSFWIVAILVGIKWHLTMALIYSSPMTRDIEHFFMSLLTISLSPVKCLFKSVAHSLKKCVIAIFFLHILDINSLSDICITNVFSQSVDCLFTFLIRIF